MGEKSSHAKGRYVTYNVTSDEQTPNQSPMVTPNEDQSTNMTPSEDLTAAPSEGLSPMLTPNTTQDFTTGWENENVGSTHQHGKLPIEATIKRSNLENVTKDFIHWNLEESAARNNEQHIDIIMANDSIEKFEHRSFIEDQAEDEIGEEAKQISFQMEQNSAEITPRFEEDSSKIKEERHKNWPTDKFLGSGKMFSVKKFKSAAHDELDTQPKVESKVQHWVDASLLQKHDNDHYKTSRFSDIKHYNQLTSDISEIPLKNGISIEQSCSMQTVTVKFMANETSAFTCAFEKSTNMRNIKETLSKTFKCPADDLQLIRNGVPLLDNLQISEMGVEPYGTVEIEIEARGSLKTESIYDVPLVPDVITVRVESSTEEIRDVVVEIESRCIRKPFVGGYRHKSTGIEYHHAFTQTPSLYLKVSAEGRRSRDTQTAEWKEKQQNTTYDVATQMAKVHHYVPSENDKILESRKYIEADSIEQEKYAGLEEKVISIQRCWRGYMARKKFIQLKQEYKKFLKWEDDETARAIKERDDRLRREIVRKIFPRTRADYEMLYAMVENWRKAEIKRISSIKTVVPKKAEFCLLLKKEIESLNTIEKYRLELKKEKTAKKELSIMEKCAMPITWTGYKGKEVSMETVHIQRAKELKELYYIMCQDNVSTKERIELLISLKYALKSYNPMMTTELISLFERECNCLVRGVKAKDLAMLRQRTQKLFIELMKDPEFNPEVAKHMVFDLNENEGKMRFCQRCQRLKPYIEFPIFAKTEKLEKCISCSWTDEIALSRIDLEPYRFMIRALRRDERRRRCFSSIAFIMQDKDFYNLIVNIWHCHSPLSEEADLYKLCLGRWDVTEDWTPWNCVLLTDTEMRAHLNIKNLEETYEPHFIADVGNKHKLAQLQFSHLYKFDKQYVGSGKWFAVKNRKEYKPPPQSSDDTLNPT